MDPTTAREPRRARNRTRWARRPRQTYRGPHRPWLMRAFNLASRGLETVREPRPIEAARILDEARRNTRLDDVGDESFLEPLDLLCRSFERDAGLNPLGRVCVRYGLSNFVANRLRIQRDLIADPTIAEQRIRRPIFVVGMPRTGSTYLHRILSAVPGCRTPKTWECYWPAPVAHRGERGREGRRLQMTRLLRAMDYVAPGIRAIHPLSPDSAEETTLMMANTFVTWTYSLIASLGAYDEWLWSEPREHVDGAYAHLRLQLQDLQSQADPGPPARWVLKSPMHLHGLDSLLRAFPDACIVQTHRDPRRVAPSTCSLFAVLRGIVTDRLDPEALGDEIVSRLSDAVTRTWAIRGRQPSRFFDVRYEDLMADPVGTVESIHRYFEFEIHDEAWQAIERGVARQPKAPVHRYTLDQFGLSEARIDKTFGEYCERYRVGVAAG